MTTPTRKPWHKRDAETSKAFHGFTVYCSLPPRSRSLDAAYTVIYHPDAAQKKKAAGHFTKWASEHSWAERAEAWDDSIRERFLDDAALDARAELDAFRRRQLAGARRMQRLASRIVDEWFRKLEEGGVEIDTATINAAMRAFDVAANAEARIVGVDEVITLLDENEPDVVG